MTSKRDDRTQQSEAMVRLRAVEYGRAVTNGSEDRDQRKRWRQPAER